MLRQISNDTYEGMNKNKISKDTVKERKSKATYLNKVKAN